MPSYLIQLSYNAETLASFIKKPNDRTPVITKLAEKLGGTLVGSWFSFGDYDAVIIIDGPDNVERSGLLDGGLRQRRVQGVQDHPIAWHRGGNGSHEEGGKSGLQTAQCQEEVGGTPGAEIAFPGYVSLCSEPLSGPGKSGGTGTVTCPVAAHWTPRASSVWKPMQSRLGQGSPTQVWPSMVV